MAPDAIIVGAGICGASAAFHLQELGREVLLIDRLGPSSGSTGRGEGNVLVCDKHPGPERELAVLGRELWTELGRRFPAARVTAKGALVINAGEDGAPAGGANPAAPPLAACAAPPLPPEPPPGLEPELAPGTHAAHHPGELQVDAAGLTRALAAAVPSRVGAEVTRVEPGAVVLSSGERLPAAHVVVATGAWAAELTRLPVRPRKGQLVALAAPRPLVRHKLVEAAYLDAAAGDEPELSIASVIEQTLDGDEILVGSSRERVGFDAAVRPEVTRAMLQRAYAFVPALRGLAVLRAWCGFRPWLPDGLPAIGAFAPRLWTSTGHEGSGVGLGPVSGLLLAQLIAGEAPVCDPGPFDPRRFRAA